MTIEHLCIASMVIALLAVGLICLHGVIDSRRRRKWGARS